MLCNLVFFLLLYLDINGCFVYIFSASFVEQCACISVANVLVLYMSQTLRKSPLSEKVVYKYFDT